MSDSGIHAQLSMHYSDFTMALDVVFPAQGVSVIFGRSGCGKTTLLRCIAGLQRAQGSVRWKQHIWQDSHQFIPTHHRSLAYVFQEPRLFPHLSVMGNLRFGFDRVSPTERNIQLDEATAWLGLDALLNHKPQQLSGGQRQRVAIARALLSSPQLLLMDEPLANLDLDSKAEILPYLEQLRTRLQIPVLYVTHAPEEMTRLADHLVLLDNGTLLAQGQLNDLLTQPDLPLAHQLDSSAVIGATVNQHDHPYHLSHVRVAGGHLTVALSTLPLGSSTRVRILARDVSIALQPSENTSISNCLPCCILDMSADRDPARMLVRLDLGGATILSRITRRSADLLALHPGQRVYAQIKAVALMH